MDNFIENTNKKNNDEISFGKYFNIIKNEQRLVIFLALIASLFGLGYSLIKKPIWRGNFQIVVQDKNSSSTSSRSINSSLNPLAGLKIAGEKQTKLEILKSASVLKPVYEIVKINNPNLNLTFDKWVRKKLNIKYKMGTDVLIVVYKNSDKEHILFTLKKIQKRFQDYSVSSRQKEISESIKFLNNKKIILSKKYEKSLAEFNKFSIENGLGNVDGFIKLTKINESSSTSGQALDLNLKSNNNFEKNNFLSPNTNSFNFSPSKAGQRYALQFDTLERYEARYENLSSKLKPNSQTIIDLKKDIENLKKALERPNQILIKYKNLEATANRNQVLLYDVINNLELSKLEQIKKLIPWEIISPPTIDELRVSPKRKQIVLTSFLGSLLLSSIIALIKNKKKGIIFEKEDFERSLNLKFDDSLDAKNLNLNTIMLKKYLNDQKNGENIAILNLKDDDIDNKKYKYFRDDFKVKFISLKKLEELENFECIVVIANSGKFRSKNLYIISKYLKVYKGNIKALFFAENN